MIHLLDMTLTISRSRSRDLSKLVLIVLLTTLCSCSNVPRALQIQDVPVDKPKIAEALPNPNPIQTYPIEWVVITKETVPSGEGWVFYALKPKDYENLARTQADTQRWVTETLWRLDYYRRKLND